MLESVSSKIVLGISIPFGCCTAINTDNKTSPRRNSFFGRLLSTSSRRISTSSRRMSLDSSSSNALPNSNNTSPPAAAERSLEQEVVEEAVKPFYSKITVHSIVEVLKPADDAKWETIVLCLDKRNSDDDVQYCSVSDATPISWDDKLVSDLIGKYVSVQNKLPIFRDAPSFDMNVWQAIKKAGNLWWVRRGKENMIFGIPECALELIYSPFEIFVRVKNRMRTPDLMPIVENSYFDVNCVLPYGEDARHFDVPHSKTILQYAVQHRLIRFAQILLDDTSLVTIDKRSFAIVLGRSAYVHNFDVLVKRQRKLSRNHPLHVLSRNPMMRLVAECLGTTALVDVNTGVLVNATSRGQAVIARAILKSDGSNFVSKLDVNKEYPEGSCLKEAISNRLPGCRDVLEYLLWSDGKYWQEPLNINATVAHDDTIRRIKYDPFINPFPGYSALHLAAMAGNGENLELLLTSDPKHWMLPLDVNLAVDTNEKNQGGLTALHLAIRNGMTKNVHIFLDADDSIFLAPLDLSIKHRGRTAYECAKQKGTNNSWEVIAQKIRLREAERWFGYCRQNDRRQ